MREYFFARILDKLLKRRFDTTNEKAIRRFLDGYTSVYLARVDSVLKEVPRRETDRFQDIQHDPELKPVEGKEVSRRELFELYGGEDGMPYVGLLEGDSAVAQRRDAPAWTMNNAHVAELIRAKYPKSESDPVERQQAGQAAQLIYMHYRLGMSDEEIFYQTMFWRSIPALKKFRQRLVEQGNAKFAQSST